MNDVTQQIQSQSRVSRLLARVLVQGRAASLPEELYEDGAPIIWPIMRHLPGRLLKRFGSDKILMLAHRGTRLADDAEHSTRTTR